MIATSESEINGDRYKIRLLANYLNETYLYLADFLNNIKETNSVQNFTSMLKIIFKSSKDNGGEREMLLESVNIVGTGARSTKLIDVLYDSLFMKY